MHIIPAPIFVLLSAAVLLRRTGGECPERLFFPFGAVSGATAYAMSSYAIGGWVERSAVLVFNTWFLLSLGRAYWLRLRGDGDQPYEAKTELGWFRSDVSRSADWQASSSRPDVHKAFVTIRQIFTPDPAEIAFVGSENIILRRTLSSHRSGVRFATAFAQSFALT